MPFKKVFRPFAGDIVRVKRKQGYYHYGIASDHFHVIHYSDFGSDSVMNASKTRIIETSLQDFLRGGECEKMNPFESPFTPEEVVERARSYLGTYRFRGQKYNFVTNNCEHFATYIYYGKADSTQVTNAAQKAVAIAGVAAGVVATLIEVNQAHKKRKEAAKKEEPLQIEEKKKQIKQKKK